MGRAKESSVVARFTSFGSSTKNGANPSGVELQRINSSRTSIGSRVDVACQEAFPPLGHQTPGLKPPRAPLFGPPTDAKPTTSAPGTGPRPSDDDIAFATRDRRRAATATQGGSILSNGAHLHPHHPLAAAAAMAAAGALSGSRGGSGVQTPDMQKLEAELAASQAQCAALQQALNAARAGASASESAAQAAASQAAAFEELATKYVAIKADAKSRMGQLHTAATQLLAAFQGQGYEVAAGLDSLQDDLEELEHLVLGESSLEVEEGVEGAGPESTSTTTPARPAAPTPIRPGATPGTPPPPDPNREKLVMLKARREHVEGEFLELVRAMVTGLERLSELSAPHHAPVTTGATPLGKTVAAAPAGPEDESLSA